MFVSGLLRGNVATPCCSPPADGASASSVSWRLHGESWLEGKYKAQTNYLFLTLEDGAIGCPETSVFTATGYVIAQKNADMFRELIEIRRVSHGVCSYVCPYINVVKHRVMLQLHSRTHRQENIKNGLKNKRHQLVNGGKIPSIYRKQITRLQNDNQSDMKLWNRTVVLHQQVQQSSCRDPNPKLS